MMRLFVAVDLPEAIQDELAGIGPGIPGASWVNPDNYHLTLRFIGEVPENVAHDVDDALTNVAAPAFDLRIKGVGHFGPIRRARTLWAGVERNEALNHLQRKVEAACVRTGLKAETRKFHPHITLARLRGETGHHLADLLARNNLFAPMAFPVTRFTLFESFLSSGGAIYQPLARYPLLGAAPENWSDDWPVEADAA